MRPLVVLLCALSAFVPARGQTGIPRSWLTDYELSNQQQTPRYARTIAYCRRLADASPWVHYESFGVSPQGRDLPLVIVSREGAFTPAAARRSGKPVILVQSGIHAGEIDGKDASLMLIRDMVLTKTAARLLDHAIVLFVPIFNVDGHERFGPYNRINQNGPKEMGWRVTAQNLNLNRDYMKADAPEMRAMLRLFTAWLPDLYIDCHVTDGIDFQYDVTYATEIGPNIDPGIAAWITQQLLPGMLRDVEAAGHKIFYYVFPREDRDISKGIDGGAATPRFSTGYAALQNRPSLLIETHMLKPYATRVSATYAILKAVLGRVGDRPSALREVVRRADSAASNCWKTPGATYPLSMDVSDKSTSVEFLGITSRSAVGEISGKPYVEYTGEPSRGIIPFYDDRIVKDSVTVPFAYIVPPEWTSVRDVLLAHGIAVQRLSAPESLTVESYRFSSVKFRERPYEGRQVATYATEPLTQRRLYPRGSLLVRMDQRTSRVAMGLLEPRDPDSFVSWGFFNAIFEQKEYAEGYVMERVGKGLFEEQPALRKEFDDKVRSDSAFAANPSARINWVYQHSPWGDAQMNLYPVGRLMTPVDVPTMKR